MWAHYAGNHNGVCLGFDAGGVSEIADMAAWVNYQTRFSKVNFWDSKAESIAHLLLSKAHDWHYEQEIRSPWYAARSCLWIKNIHPAYRGYQERSPGRWLFRCGIQEGDDG
jgi:hypothetical protein